MCFFRLHWSPPLLEVTTTINIYLTVCVVSSETTWDSFVTEKTLRCPRCYSPLFHHGRPGSISGLSCYPRCYSPLFHHGRPGSISSLSCYTRCYSPLFHHGRPGSISGLSVRDFLWRNRHWWMIFSYCARIYRRTRPSTSSVLPYLIASTSVRVQLKCGGTRWRTGGKVKGKMANGVGSQYPSHYLGTWCIQHYYRWCAHLGCQ